MLLLSSPGPKLVTRLGEAIPHVSDTGAAGAGEARSGDPYAEHAVVPAKRLVKVPSAIDFQTAAAVMLQGLTAHYLTHSTYALEPGDTALVHAAAGGVGQLITQVARLRGATVYGTVGGEAKAAIARATGAAAAIDYRTQDFEAEIKKLTNGRGVGIRNTCERLQVLYGERGVVQVHNTEPGLRVALTFPAEAAAQRAA